MGEGELVGCVCCRGWQGLGCILDIENGERCTDHSSSLSMSQCGVSSRVSAALLCYGYCCSHLVLLGMSSKLPNPSPDFLNSRPFATSTLTAFKLRCKAKNSEQDREFQLSNAVA